METESGYLPSEALRDAQSARQQIADRAVAPRYYYPALSVVVALLVGSEAIGGPLAFIACIVCAVVSGLLIGQYREATGLLVTYGSAGRRARPVWIGYAAALLGLMAVALWVQLTDRSGWWGTPLGLLAFGMTLMVGRVFEPRLRQDLRDGTSVARR